MDPHDELFDAWDELDGAVKAIQTCQPFQMTERAERLEAARKRMSAAVRAVGRLSATPSQEPNP